MLSHCGDNRLQKKMSVVGLLPNPTPSTVELRRICGFGYGCSGRRSEDARFEMYIQRAASPVDVSILLVEPRQGNIIPSSSFTLLSTKVNAATRTLIWLKAPLLHSRITHNCRPSRVPNNHLHTPHNESLLPQAASSRHPKCLNPTWSHDLLTPLTTLA